MTAEKVTLFGIDFYFRDFQDSGYLDDVEVDGVVYPRHAAVLVAATKQIAGLQRTTSTSSLAIGTGSKAFTLAEDIALVKGQRILASDNSNPATNYMYGTVTAYDGTTKALTLNVTDISGSGTIADWSIATMGLKGTIGFPSVVRSSNTALAATDNGKLIIADTAFTQTINAISTLPDDWTVEYKNASTGDIVIDPNSSEQIEGQTTYRLLPGETVKIHKKSSTLRIIGAYSDEGYLVVNPGNPGNGDIVFVFHAPFPGSMEEVGGQTASGSLSIQAKVNSTSVTHSGPTAINSSGQSAACTANNTFVKGDKLLMTVSSSSSPTEASLYMRVRRKPT